MREKLDLEKFKSGKTPGTKRKRKHLGFRQFKKKKGNVNN